MNSLSIWRPDKRSIKLVRRNAKKSEKKVGSRFSKAKSSPKNSSRSLGIAWPSISRLSMDSKTISSSSTTKSERSARKRKEFFKSSSTYAGPRKNSSKKDSLNSTTTSIPIRMSSTEVSCSHLSSEAWIRLKKRKRKKTTRIRKRRKKKQLPRLNRRNRFSMKNSGLFSTILSSSTPTTLKGTK